MKSIHGTIKVIVSHDMYEININSMLPQSIYQPDRLTDLMREGTEGWGWEEIEDSCDERGLGEIKTGRLYKSKGRLFSDFKKRQGFHHKTTA